MIISQGTIAVLKNFATINQSLLVRGGSELRTQNPQGNMFASAKIDDVFPRFAVYELNKFLGVLSLFPDADVNFHENHLTISHDKSKIKYVYADESVVVNVPETDPKTAAVVATFQMPWLTFQAAYKAARVMDLQDLTIEGAEGSMSLVVRDQKNPSNEFRMTVGQVSDTFTFDLKFENLKLLEGNYTVEVHKTLKGRYVVVFKGDKGSYWVSTEATSVASV